MYIMDDNFDAEMFELMQYHLKCEKIDEFEKSGSGTAAQKAAQKEGGAIQQVLATEAEDREEFLKDQYQLMVKQSEDYDEQFESEKMRLIRKKQHQ